MNPHDIEVAPISKRLQAVKKQMAYVEERKELLDILKSYQANPQSIPMVEFGISNVQLVELITAIESDFAISTKVCAAVDTYSEDPEDRLDLNGTPIGDMFDLAIKNINDEREHINRRNFGKTYGKGDPIPMLVYVPRFSQLSKADVLDYEVRFGITKEELLNAKVPTDLFDGLAHFVNNNGFLGQQFYITHLPMKGIGRQVRLWNIFPTKYNRTSFVGAYRLTHIIPSAKDIAKAQPLQDDTADEALLKLKSQHPHYVFGKA